MNIREELFKNQDLDYKEFHKKLVPNIDSNRIIGVRIPTLRELAKAAAREDASNELYYYEEIMIEGLKIGYKKCNIGERLELVRDFVPLIDNWAVCDSCCSTYKFAKKHRREVWDFIIPYINKSEFETRFAIVMMMDYYLDDEYIERVVSAFKSVNTGEYYVDMALAWALSVVYVSYPEKVEKMLDSNALSPWVHNKAIQKICESYRVDKDKKEYLKTKKRAIK